jgi:hypothetical protein
MSHCIQSPDFAYGPYSFENWPVLRIKAAGLDLEVDVAGDAFTRDQVRQLLCDVMEMALRRDRSCRRQDGWVRGDEWCGALLGIVQGVLRECCVPEDSAAEIQQRTAHYLQQRSQGFFSV